MKKTPILQPCFEKVIVEGDENFSIEEVSGETLRCVYHYHPEYEITCIVSGSGNRLVGESLEPYGPGDLVLVGGSLPHHYASSRPSDQSRTMSRVIKFNPDCLGRDFFEMKEMAPVKRLLETACNGVAFPLETYARISEKIAELFQVSGPRRIVLFLDILSELASSETRYLTTGKSRVTPNDLETARMDRALACINDNIGRKLTLAQVSRTVGLAPPVFSRFFSKVARKTFSRYVQELRISNACNLLLESEWSVSEICYSSGFSNLSNFNRLFRKTKGMTPREFRNRARQAVTHPPSE